MLRGTCPDCFTDVRLTEQERCQPHRRNYKTGSGCPGEGELALDELSRQQEQVVRFIQATIEVTNTSQMSEQNARRVALAVFWNLRQNDRWMLLARP